MHVGINLIGMVNVIYQLQLRGKITSSVKQSVQDTAQERMKDLSVPMSIDQTKISGIVTGKILDVWKLQEMLAGIQNSGMTHVKVQN